MSFDLLNFNKIIIASSNSGKIREIKSYLKNIELISASDVGLLDVEETENTLEGNALLKAENCFEKTKMPSLADDAGFFLNALDGFPGIHCGRFADRFGHRDFSWAAKELNERLSHTNDKTCYFASAMVFVFNDIKIITHGEMPGNFVYPGIMGKDINNGGYNPYFMPENSETTYAVLKDNMDNIQTHRTIALQKMIEKLENIYSK